MFLKTENLSLIMCRKHCMQRRKCWLPGGALLFLLHIDQPITTQCRILTHQRYVAVENIVRKGEIACNKQFLLFSQCFSPYMALIFHFKCSFKMSSAICFKLDQSKILSSGNGLTNKVLVGGYLVCFVTDLVNFAVINAGTRFF